jgi:hypothetical protein
MDHVASEDPPGTFANFLLLDCPFLNFTDGHLHERLGQELEVWWLFRLSRGAVAWPWMAFAVIGECRPTVPGGVDSQAF